MLTDTELRAARISQGDSLVRKWPFISGKMPWVTQVVFTSGSPSEARAA